MTSKNEIRYVDDLELKNLSGAVGPYRSSFGNQFPLASVVFGLVNGIIVLTMGTGKVHFSFGKYAS